MLHSKHKVLVIAGNHGQFRSWLHTIKDLDAARYVYVQSLDAIQGACGDTFVTVGTYWENPLYKNFIPPELEQLARTAFFQAGDFVVYKYIEASKVFTMWLFTIKEIYEHECTLHRRIPQGARGGLRTIENVKLYELRKAGTKEINACKRIASSFLKRPSPVEFEATANQLARDFAPEVQTCRACRWPVLHGHRCAYCGEIDP